MKFRNKKTNTVLNVVSESIVNSFRKNPNYEEVVSIVKTPLLDKKENKEIKNKGKNKENTKNRR